MQSAPLSRDDLHVLEPPGPMALVKLDQSVRLTFAELALRRASAQEVIELLDRSARYLEQRRAIAGISEAVEILEIDTTRQLEEKVEEVLDVARKLTRIDPIAVLLNDQEFLEAHGSATRSTPRLETKPPGAFEALVRAVSSLLESCPIDALVELASEMDRPDLGHRCRLSFDWLRAFLHRNSGTFNAVEQIIGRAFAQGRLSREEASGLLSLPLHDGVAWLEEQGYARDLNVIALDEPTRARRVADIRADRLRRGGMPSGDRALVARDVVASQRIEDIDARRWVQFPQNQ